MVFIKRTVKRVGSTFEDDVDRPRARFRIRGTLGDDAHFLNPVGRQPRGGGVGVSALVHGRQLPVCVHVLRAVDIEAHGAAGRTIDRDLRKGVGRVGGGARQEKREASVVVVAHGQFGYLLLRDIAADRIGLSLQHRRGGTNLDPHLDRSGYERHADFVHLVQARDDVGLDGGLETALCDRQLEGCQRQLLEVKRASAVGFYGMFQADVGRGKHHLGAFDGPTRAVEHSAGDAAGKYLGVQTPGKNKDQT